MGLSLMVKWFLSDCCPSFFFVLNHTHIISFELLYSMWCWFADWGSGSLIQIRTFRCLFVNWYVKIACGYITMLRFLHSLFKHVNDGMFFSGFVYSNFHHTWYWFFFSLQLWALISHLFRVFHSITEQLKRHKFPACVYLFNRMKNKIQRYFILMHGSWTISKWTSQN